MLLSNQNFELEISQTGMDGGGNVHGNELV